MNALKRIGMAAIPLIIPFILYLNSPLENAGGAVEWVLRRKAYSLLIPFLGYSLAIDLLVIAPIVGFLIYCLYSKKAWISRPLALCFCVLLINYAILPQTIKGGFWVDSRMMAMLGFVIFAGFVPRGLTARQEAVLASVIAVLFLVKVGFIADVWRSSQRDVNSVREVVSQVEPGSMVLEADVTKDENPAWFAAMPLGRNISLLNRHTGTWAHSCCWIGTHSGRQFSLSTASSRSAYLILTARAWAAGRLLLIIIFWTHASCRQKRNSGFRLSQTGPTTSTICVLNAEGARDLDHFCRINLNS